MASITVNNWDELKAALNNTAYNVIDIGASITFSASGVTVMKNRDILIDGHGYTFNDYNSGAASATINMQNAVGVPVTITIKDIVWNGKNWYGCIFCPENTNSNNITLVYDGIEYIGPQPIHNAYGTTIVRNSNFLVVSNGSVNPAQEFAEARKIFFEGTVTVDSSATGSAIIYFLSANSEFVVEEDASLSMTAVNYFIYNSAAGQPSMTLKSRSSTRIHTRYGLFWSTGATTHILSSFELRSGASFYHSQSERRAATIPSFKCRDSFVVGEGGSFQLFMPSAGSSSLMYFGNRCTVDFNKPKSVILYNNGGNIFEFQASGNSLSFDAEQINRWTVAAPLSTAGTFSNLPNFHFMKADGENVVATLTAGVSSITTAVSSNIVTGDDGYPMNNSTFNIFSTPVLSLGNLQLSLHTVSDISTSILGVTEVAATVKGSYATVTIPETMVPDGNIDIAIPAPIQPSTSIDFKGNWNFLYKEIFVESVGCLRLNLEDLSFRCFAVPLNASIVRRVDSNWKIDIIDTRVGGGEWFIYATLTEPISHDDAEIENALIFVEGENKRILSSEPSLIARGFTTPPETEQTISWGANEGFLLEVDPDGIYPAGVYTADVQWIVSGEEI